MSVVVQVFIMRNGAFEGTEMVTGDRFEIGRDPSMSIVLDDDSCSRRHAVVTCQDGRVFVQDLGSHNGTRVNGDPIVGVRAVGPREDVTIGVFTLKLKVMTPAANKTSAPPTAPIDPVRSVQVRAPAAGVQGPESDATIVAGDPASLTEPSPPPPYPDEVAAHQSLQFTPAGDEGDEEADEIDGFSEVSWSLVERLVRPAESARSGKNALVEIVHYRGESVVDHRVLHEGERFDLGRSMSRAERIERGIDKVLPLVRLKKDGVAEILLNPPVQGRLLRQGQQVDLPSGGKRGAGMPLVDGELASLRVGNERVFVRVAGVPQLVWTKEDALEERAARRLTTIAMGASFGFFFLFGMASWIYSFRSAREDVIQIEDDGFAEVLKELEFEEPKKPEPLRLPIEPLEPVAQKQPDKTPPKATPSAKVDAKAPTPAMPQEPAKPGVMDILNNIPKVSDNASNQNLNAALSNIKGVRVPGGAQGFKTSALVGKGPSSGVQIGGAAGGVATSGINSLIRKDGAAGALGGKGDRAVAGRVSVQPRLTQTKGQGELSKDEILRVINSHIGEIQFCYEKQLRTNAGLAGRVVLEWSVSPSGSVSVVKVQTASLASTAATRCMVDKLKGWRFPKPKGNAAVTVVFPFVFNTV